MGTFEEFRNPPREYAPLFFWFLNGYLDPDAITRQVEEMGAKGAAGAVMHARHGLRVNYLSNEWMDRIGAAIKQAKKSNIQAWLYDEYNWPSGSAAEKVTEKHPQWQSHYLRYEFIEAGESIPDFLEEEQILKIFMIDGRGQSPRSHRSLSLAVPLDQRLELLEGDERLLVFSVGKNRYIDVLNPEPTQKFIELTHNAYYKKFGREFGKTIPGIFADEVTLMNVWGRLPRRSFPYTPPLEKILINHWGMNLDDFLPHLVLDFGPESSAMRIRFFETIIKLYVDAFFEPLGKWCEKHRITFTGHLLAEEPLFSSVRHQADTFPIYAEMQTPGVDHLGLEIEGIHHKIASSVAHVWGRERVLSESFGASGWGTDLNDKRLTLDWQITQGINQFCVHGAFFTIRGKRKRENPPSEFIQEPWWKHYRAWADYVARLCRLFSLGEHKAPVLVPFPVRSAWAQFRPDPPPAFHRLERNLLLLAEALGSVQYDFDFIDEDVMADMKIQSGQVLSNYESYRMLVLPSAWVWNKTTFDWIMRAMESGVRVLQIGSVPKWLWDENRLMAVNPEEWGPVKTVNVREMRDRELFRACMEAETTPDLWVDGDQPGMVRYVLRQQARRKCCMVHNTAKRENSLKIRFNETGSLWVWDPWTGEKTELEPRLKPDKTWEGALAAEASIVFVIEREPGKIVRRKPADKGPAAVKIISLTDSWTMERMGPNCLVLPDWRARIPGQKHFKILAPRQPVKIQSSLEPIEVINPAQAEFRCRFWIKEQPADLNLVIEPIEAPFEVRLNGRTLELELGMEQDPEMLQAPIAEKVSVGRNEILLRANYRKIHINLPDYLNRISTDLVPDPPRLMGDFRCIKLARTWGVALDAPGPRETKPGSWTELGYPHFSGTMKYKTFFTLRKEWVSERYSLFLEIPGIKNVAEIFVNGTPLGLKMIAPWELALAMENLKSGKNILEILVTNTAANWVLGDPKPSGILQPPCLRLERR